MNFAINKDDRLMVTAYNIHIKGIDTLIKPNGYVAEEAFIRILNAYPNNNITFQDDYILMPTDEIRKYSNYIIWNELKFLFTEITPKVFLYLI